MKTPVARPLLALAVTGLVAAGCGDTPTAADPTLEPTDVQAARHGGAGGGTALYSADLEALNGSGVTGKARILVKANGDFQVVLSARGVTPDIVHPQHIHGFVDPVESSQCPTLATDDVDDSGLIEVAEGADGIGQDYGGVLVPLDGSLDVAEGLGEIATFPVANRGGNYLYNETISTDELALNGGFEFEDLALSEHAIVLHGMMVGGVYVATLPVACGTLSRVN